MMKTHLGLFLPDYHDQSFLETMSNPSSTRNSLAENKELTNEERKRAIAARNQLSKGDNDQNLIIEGYQLLDVGLW